MTSLFDDVLERRHLKSGWGCRRTTVLVLAVAFVGALEVVALGAAWARGAAHGAALSAVREVRALPGAQSPPANATDAEATISPSVDVQNARDDTDDVPVWKLPLEFEGKFVAAFSSGRSIKDAAAWARASRFWRRGIPAAVATFYEPSPEVAADGARHGETWVRWAPKKPLPGARFMGLFAMTPSLAADALSRQHEFDWMLFGDDDTVFNLDVVIRAVQGLDPSLPHLVTDHLWYRQHGPGPRQRVPHGSPMAPRCVKCGVEPAVVPGHQNWRPPQVCGEACTWARINESDPERPELYAGPNGFKPIYPPKGELIVHGGAGMLLSRGLLEKANATYMEHCMRTKFEGTRIPGGDTLFSHCLFFQGIAPLDPGSFARDARIEAFGPTSYQARGAIEDAYSYSKSYRCCNVLCQRRLRNTISIHLRTSHYKHGSQAREALRAMQRARDAYLYTRQLEKNSSVVPFSQSWDWDRACQ